MQKPKLFIGSASESIRYVNAVHQALSRVAEVTPWHAGAFRAGDYTMEALERQLERSDFAVFILSADDMAVMRGSTVLVPRDNTVFELGLFWGKLRKERVFFLVPDRIEDGNKEREGLTAQTFHLPSDLLGLTVLTLESRTDGNMEAAVNIACAEIAGQIAKLGIHPDNRQSKEQLQAALRQSQNLLHFFMEFTRKAFRDDFEPYERLYEAIRNGYDPSVLGSFRVTGAAVWRAKESGLAQMAGNVGQHRFFPFNVNEGKREGESRVLVVDAYLNSTMRILRLDKPVAASYLLCYPVGKEFVVTIHLSGSSDADDLPLRELVEQNEELMGTVHYLLGGDSI
ncbi:TIR domain-containing protein [Paenibacillus protaetiae]|uniref:CD-NTase-associated protein 12/Pycsar effector protein TIR domain-containing protein n=1 Tax=Paenibacillus protaetiae TaxID=2509456 RepID=A0A4P6ES32_9BACL|nr:nucleotide-binding protein [Paenibacillus protaetiae]QAY65732.1 hypothetical protein ET464_04395 [Paenibacillus protaetiae]